ncbi:MAG: DNA translocase FtsK [Leptospirales bacterium]
MEHSEANSPGAGPGSPPGGALKKSGVTEIFGTLMILVGILIFLALISFQSQAPGEGDVLQPEANMIGTVGHYSAQLLFFLFGKSAFLLGPYLFLLGFLTFYRGGFTDPLSRVVAALVVMAGTSLLGALVYQVEGVPSEIAGGLLGARVGQAFQVLFGTYGGFILAIGIFLTGVFLAIRIPVPVFLGQLNHRLIAALRGYSRALNGEGQMGYREAYHMAGAGTTAGIAPGPEAVAAAPGGNQVNDRAQHEGTSDHMRDANGMNQQLIRKEEAIAAGEQRPWVERVVAADEAARGPGDDFEDHQQATSGASETSDRQEGDETADDVDILYNDFPEEPVREASPGIRGLSQRTRLSSNARHLQATLSQIESRSGRSDWLGAARGPSAFTARNETTARGRNEVPADEHGAPRRESGSERDLAGYFNEDESRFHFRATRPGTNRSGAARAFAPDSSSVSRGAQVGRERDSVYSRESGRRTLDPRAPAGARRYSSAIEAYNDHKGAGADAAFLEPLDLDLIRRRERPADRARAHALADLQEPSRAAEGLEGEALDRTSAPDSTLKVQAPNVTQGGAAGADEFQEALDSAADGAAVYRARDFEDSENPESVAEGSGDPSDFGSEIDEQVDEAAPESANEFDVAPPDQDFAEDLAGAPGEDLVEASVADFVDAPAPRVQRQPRKKPVPVSAVPKFQAKSATRRYHLPGNLLQPAEVPPREDVSREIEVTRERLEKVMQDYGIQARVVRTQRGPIITLYEIKLEAGVRVSRILGISDEIKMNLEAPSIRIIAPIPGRPTVGIEIPNRHREGVVLGDMLDRDVMARNELCVVLGKNIAGEKQYVDLARLPHLLIAGSTGSGKSVYMNAIIASLLYTRSPEDVRFIMIDPKMVELKLFEGIPHLIMPVITDVRQASKALTWVIGEMERRYEILSHLKSRDIRSYNDRVAAETRLPGFEAPEGAEGKREKMPYIVVFIDELSDLMMVAAKDVEDSIIRLTQKARAVGIHIVMATQRPSVDVITALIKANCPARIAFHVAQKTDSRTILDMNGAETLLGKGDMLYRSPSSTALVRLQAPLLTEAEIESVVQETARYGQPAYVDLEAYIDEENTEAAENDVDSELLQQAWKIVLESGKTSTSYIQRRLRIGYNRAASLIEMLEQKGYLSPAIGNKPREILKRS